MQALGPFALRMGIALHTPKRYWPAVYGAEWWLTVSLAILLEQPQWLTVLAASAASVPVLWFASPYYRGSQGQKLGVMGLVIVMTSLINTLAVAAHGPHIPMVFLVSLTGGTMLVPTCYLVWNYLFQSTWQPLTTRLLSRPVHFRLSHLIFYAMLFVLSIVLQLILPEELRRFAPFCLAIPIILLAFRYGWQGALLGTLLNSIALIAARSGVSNMEITDLLLSLLAQSLTGILLGAAVQRQRDLNAQLRHELDRNHNLSRQLVKAEESVRRDIARELHDEIGQNITAIRTQASIIQRVESTPVSAGCARTIETLSLNVYDTTKGMLSRLRPKTLDDLGLKEAIEQMLTDMEFEAHGMTIHTRWELSQPDAISQLSDTTKVTLYRLCQEALNNALKYSGADQIELRLRFEEQLHLMVADNGVGCKAEDHMKGFGLRGMRERVQALGGQFSLSHSRRFTSGNGPGTEIAIQLPRL